MAADLAVVASIQRRARVPPSGLLVTIPRMHVFLFHFLESIDLFSGLAMREVVLNSSSDSGARTGHENLAGVRALVGCTPEEENIAQDAQDE
jgi:hypothetical protein